MPKTKPQQNFLADAQSQAKSKLAPKKKPEPEIIRSPVGPQPPPICSPSELEIIKIALANLCQPGPDGLITLRKVSATVDYLVQKQQWESIK